MSDVRAVARLAWRRLWRGRTIWATAILVIVPLGVAALMLAPSLSEGDKSWTMVCELTFRSLVVLAPVLHLAPAINEENDGKTYTYLWSRPVRREALLYGKLLAVAPAVALAATASLITGFILLSLGPNRPDVSLLPRALLAVAVGVTAASCYALGIGALFPRHPLVAAMAFIFFGEQILPEVNAVQNVSVLYHVRTVAALPYSPYPWEGSLAKGLIALAILSAVWLSIAVWRVRRLELGSADG